MNEAVALPQVVQELIEIAGADAAWALVREKGGQQIYLPGKVKQDHWLAKLVGLDAAEKICTFYRAGASGGHLLIPMASAAQRQAAFGRAIESGGSNNRVAAELGVHERTVRRHRARIRDDKQGNLF